VRRVRAYAAVLAVVLVTTSAVGVGAESSGDNGRLPASDVLGGRQATAVDGVTAGGDSSVEVGVIGTAFDPDRDSVESRVVDSRRIGGSPLSFGRGPTGHDTAVAEVVAEQSPSAALYLAGVGSRPTADRYATAVGWLLERNVDVIVDAGSYFPQTAAGHDRFEAAAERAAAAGVVFVTSAGNYAQRHWRGRATDTGWVTFDGETRRNALRGTDGSRTVEGQVTLRLYRRDGTAGASTTDYDLYLYRAVADGRDRLVASSTRTSGAAEAIDTTVPSGEYYVQLHADGAAGRGPPVDLFAARHRLSHPAREGSSLPPATAPEVIAVGAVDSDGEPARYATGVGDVRAGDTVVTDTIGRVRGTSAATPVVAGTVTHMLADGHRLSPGEVETILRETADGSRQVDPDAAVARAGELAGRQRGVTASVWTGGVSNDAGAGDAASVGNTTSSVEAISAEPPVPTGRHSTQATLDGSA
jgi:hypothetical protein